MTVDWDEELRKLNASDLARRRAKRDRSKTDSDPEVVNWAKANARKAKSAAKETTYKARAHDAFVTWLHFHVSTPATHLFLVCFGAGITALVVAVLAVMSASSFERLCSVFVADFCV